MKIWLIGSPSSARVATTVVGRNRSSCPSSWPHTYTAMKRARRSDCISLMVTTETKRERERERVSGLS